MNYLVVDLYQDFECIGGACSNTCCAGWKITIDDETYQKMIDNEDRLGIPAKDWIVDVDGVHCAKLCNQRCQMLDEQNLCRVVSTLGPDYLSNTCSVYPRNLNQYGNVAEAYVRISCPTVIDMLMKKDTVAFDLGQDNTPAAPYAHSTLYLFESGVRTSIIQLMQLPVKVSLTSRIYAAYKLLENALDLYREGKLNLQLLAPMVKLYSDPNVLTTLDMKLCNVVNESSRQQFLKQLYPVLLSKNQPRRIVELIKQTKDYFDRTDSATYVEDMQNYRNSLASYQSFYINYWVYQLFSALIAIPDYQKAADQFIYTAAEFCLAQTIAFASYATNGKLDREEYIYIFSCVGRRMEHNPDFRKQIMEVLGKNDVGMAGVLLMVIA